METEAAVLFDERITILAKAHFDLISYNGCELIVPSPYQGHRYGSAEGAACLSPQSTYCANLGKFGSFRHLQ